MKPVVKNAADPSQVKEAEIKSRIGRERDEDDLRTILNSIQGRRFLWKLLGLTGLYETSFRDFQSPNAAEIAFYYEGARNIGIKLITDITSVSPEAYLLMVQEAKKEEENG